jgi:hypothetical protein
MDEEPKKLNVFLDYLIQHNRDHAEEIIGLAQVAKDLEELEACDDLEKGAEYMRLANRSLDHALSILKGKVK